MLATIRRIQIQSSPLSCWLCGEKKAAEKKNYTQNLDGFEGFTNGMFLVIVKVNRIIFFYFVRLPLEVFEARAEKKNDFL